MRVEGEGEGEGKGGGGGGGEVLSPRVGLLHRVVNALVLVAIGHTFPQHLYRFNRDQYL